MYRLERLIQLSRLLRDIWKSLHVASLGNIQGRSPRCRLQISHIPRISKISKAGASMPGEFVRPAEMCPRAYLVVSWYGISWIVFGYP